MKEPESEIDIEDLNSVGMRAEKGETESKGGD
jgi:hypothetical protein